VDLLRRAAEQGNNDAEYNLGVCLRRGIGIPADVNAARRYYRSAALSNHVSAQLALGDLIAESATSDSDWSEAMHWYRLAAENGNTNAKARLAQVKQSRHGLDVERTGRTAAIPG
jgi:TPR repeat protein